jgi:molecular chaperone DnaJ
VVESSWFETDFYAILGVSKSATNKEITRAYRTLAKKLHPDTNPAGAEKFKEVSGAYDVLGKEEVRAEYDAVRAAPRPSAYQRTSQGANNFTSPDYATSGFPAPGFSQDDFDPAQFSDLFSSMFRTPRSTRGGDFVTTITLPFRDAIQGTTTQLRLEHQSVCSACHGLGEAHDTACVQCEATGYETSVAKVTVRIPAGVEDQQRIKIPRKGQPSSSGGHPGDLYVVVTVTPDPIFTREGKNLITSIRIDAIAAMLGTEVEIPTLDEAVTVKITPGTQPGATLRVRGKGVPTRHTPGDLLVRVFVTVPRHITVRQQELLQQFEKEMADTSRGSS